MDSFRYLPLDPQTASIRLVRLFRGNTLEVVCELFHASLSGPEATSYEALSYTWGCTELVECIELNSKKLHVTENLHAVLQCLRYHDKDRILWIDAICINQEDLEERSQQVRQMGAIFRSASQVIFWPGKPTVEISLLMNHLNELDNRRSKSSTTENTEIDEAHLNGLWSEIQQTAQSGTTDLLIRQQKGMSQLLKRPWFQRVWILQEVANSQSAVLCCGGLSTPAHLFALSPSLLGMKIDPHSRSILDIMPGRARIDSWWSREREVISLRHKFSASKATDERDLIFALLEMSFEPRDHKFLRINYSTPLHKVVKSAVRYWFEETDIPVSKVFNFIASFQDIRATYLVITYDEREPDIAHSDPRPPPFVRDSVEYNRDASFLLVERYNQDLDGNNACYTDLDGKELWPEHFATETDASGYNVFRNAFQIVPWVSSRQALKILAITDISAALERIAFNRWGRTLEFIAERITDDKQLLLDETLIRIATRGSVYAVELLLDHGADINFSFTRGVTALGRAAKRGHLEVVKLLLRQGGADHKSASLSSCGCALVRASGAGHLEVVQVLLDHGADVNYCYSGELYGTALANASRHGHLALAQLLLDHGANVDGRPSVGVAYTTPLREASSVNNLEMARKLLDHGANPNADARNSNGNAITSASRHYDSHMVRLLLERGANPNIWADPDRMHGSALHQAMQDQSWESARILREYGAVLKDDEMQELIVREQRTVMDGGEREKPTTINIDTYISDEILRAAAWSIKYPQRSHSPIESQESREHSPIQVAVEDYEQTDQESAD